jgi:hypothetical protein
MASWHEETVRRMYDVLNRSESVDAVMRNSKTWRTRRSSTSTPKTQ